MNPTPWLSLTIWIPILFGLAVLMFSDRHATLVRQLSLVGALLGLAAYNIERCIGISRQ